MISRFRGARRRHLRRHALGVALAAAMAGGLAAAEPVGAQAAPTPESIIGFPPCADYQLATYEQIVEYFHRLDAATDRMRMVDIGTTAEGRTQVMAIISSERNLRELDGFRDIARRLALGEPEPEEADRLAAQGKAIVWIDFGLHSTEVAHAQTAPLVAHRVVTEESEEMRRIRDEVIFLLVPNLNPDGTTLVSEWYMDHVGGPYQDSSPPRLYHKYVGHDNNRDWFMFNMPESRNVARLLYEQWFPQIVYNQHQTGPYPSRIFVPPFQEPMNPNIPPLVMRGVNTVGDAITRRLEQENKVGAISRVGFDTWWNGGMRTAPYYHNMIGILTETSHASATPATYDPSTFPDTFANGVPTLEPTTFYPSPYRGGEWHLRDSCDYMVTASLAVLDIGATRRREWLSNIYQMARDAMRAGADETYVVPADQWDPGTAVKMVNVLRRGGIAVHRATEPFTAAGREYAAGSFVIRGAQPFRPYLTDLLNPQRYPDLRQYPGGPPRRPYDVSGWTLSSQMGVTVERLDEAVTAAVEPVGMADPPTGGLPSATGWALAVDPRTNDAFTLVNRLLTANIQVFRATTPLEVAGARWPAGAFLVRDTPESRGRLGPEASALGLTLRRVPDEPDGLFELTRPRVGLYQAHGGNMDEGWTRWLLEQFEFAFTSLHDAEIRSGDLRARLDVIVLPDATYEQMLTGLAHGTMPPEFTGGMTARGIAHLYDFVEAGGTLVTLDTASQLPLTTFGLPIRDVTEDQSSSSFFVPGSLLAVDVDTGHPLAYGLTPRVTSFFARSPAFAVGRSPTRRERMAGQAPESPDGIAVVGRYPANDILVSGWMLGASVLAERAAIVEANVGRGRVVLLGFRVQHRAQPHGTFKLLFNALLRGASRTTAETDQKMAVRR